MILRIDSNAFASAPVHKRYRYIFLMNYCLYQIPIEQGPVCCLICDFQYAMLQNGVVTRKVYAVYWKRVYSGTDIFLTNILAPSWVGIAKSIPARLSVVFDYIGVKMSFPYIDMLQPIFRYPYSNTHLFYTQNTFKLWAVLFPNASTSLHSSLWSSSSLYIYVAQQAQVCDKFRVV